MFYFSNALSTSTIHVLGSGIIHTQIMPEFDSVSYLLTLVARVIVLLLV